MCYWHEKVKMTCSLLLQALAWMQTSEGARSSVHCPEVRSSAGLDCVEEIVTGPLS